MYLAFNQPWFTEECERCANLDKIPLSHGVAAVCPLIEEGKSCKFEAIEESEEDELKFI